MAEKTTYTPSGTKILGQMHRVMDKSREEWEKETNVLKNEFFNMKPNENLFGKGDRLGRFDIKGFLGHMDANGVFVQACETTGNFKVRMDVNGFCADGITIHSQNSKLIVQAKHEEANNGKNISREFSRQIDIPGYVDPNSLKSVLGKDGILEIEAPMCSPSNRKGQGHIEVRRSEENGLTAGTSFVQKCPILQSEFEKDIFNPGLQFTLKNHIFKESIVNCRVTCSSPDPETKSRIIYTEHDDIQRVKWVVDLGAGFAPEDIRVKVVRDKLQIIGKHEEGSNFKRCKKEYSKEFEIPDNVDQSTLRASISKDGKVIIRANTGLPI